MLVRAFAWLTLLRTEGVINQALLGWGLIAQPLALVRNELGVVIGMVHYMVPVRRAAALRQHAGHRPPARRRGARRWAPGR